MEKINLLTVIVSVIASAITVNFISYLFWMNLINRLDKKTSSHIKETENVIIDILNKRKWFIYMLSHKTK